MLYTVLFLITVFVTSAAQSSTITTASTTTPVLPGVPLQSGRFFTDTLFRVVAVDFESGQDYDNLVCTGEWVNMLNQSNPNPDLQYLLRSVCPPFGRIIRVYNTDEGYRIQPVIVCTSTYCKIQLENHRVDFCPLVRIDCFQESTASTTTITPSTTTAAPSTTTAAPSTTTAAPSTTTAGETSSSRNCNDIRIYDASSQYEGLVTLHDYLLSYPDDVWFTVCAAGVGLNEAKVFCRMSLCNSLGDMYALPFFYNFDSWGQPSLVGLQCRGNESHFSQCSFSAYDLTCPYENFVGVSCNFIPTDSGPADPIVSVVCQNGMASVGLSKSVDSTLSSQVVALNDSLYSCGPEIFEDSQFVNITFQFDSCNPIVQVNETHISYITTFLKFQVSNDGSGTPFRTVDYSFDVTCMQPKSSLASGDLNTQITNFEGQDEGDNFVSNIMIYRTPYFEQPVSWPETALTGQTLYAVVSLNTGINQLRLFLSKCWATSENDINSPVVRVFINDKCAQGESNIFPINDTAVMFSFETVELLNNGNDTRASDPTFLWCDTFTCTKTEDTPFCLQACESPLPSLKRRKRSAHMNYSVRSSPLRIHKRRR